MLSCYVYTKFTIVDSIFMAHGLPQCDLWGGGSNCPGRVVQLFRRWEFEMHISPYVCSCPSLNVATENHTHPTSDVIWVGPTCRNIYNCQTCVGITKDGKVHYMQEKQQERRSGLDGQLWLFWGKTGCLWSTCSFQQSPGASSPTLSDFAMDTASSSFTTAAVVKQSFVRAKSRAVSALTSTLSIG